MSPAAATAVALGQGQPRLAEGARPRTAGFGGLGHRCGAVGGDSAADSAPVPLSRLLLPTRLVAVGLEDPVRWLGLSLASIIRQQLNLSRSRFDCPLINPAAEVLLPRCETNNKAPSTTEREREWRHCNTSSVRVISLFHRGYCLLTDAAR